MEFHDKLALIRLLLQGRERDASQAGFCDRERSEIRTSLLLHGYLEEASSAGPDDDYLREERGSRYTMTDEGRRFLNRLERRTAV